MASDDKGGDYQDNDRRGAYDFVDLGVPRDPGAAINGATVEPEEGVAEVIEPERGEGEQPGTRSAGEPGRHESGAESEQGEGNSPGPGQTLGYQEDPGVRRAQ